MRVNFTILTFKIGDLYTYLPIYVLKFSNFMYICNFMYISINMRLSHVLLNVWQDSIQLKIILKINIPKLLVCYL